MFINNTNKPSNTVCVWWSTSPKYCGLKADLYLLCKQKKSYLVFGSILQKNFDLKLIAEFKDKNVKDCTHIFLKIENLQATILKIQNMAKDMNFSFSPIVSAFQPIPVTKDLNITPLSKFNITCSATDNKVNGTTDPYFPKIETLPDQEPLEDLDPQ